MIFRSNPTQRSFTVYNAAHTAGTDWPAGPCATQSGTPTAPSDWSAALSVRPVTPLHPSPLSLPLLLPQQVGLSGRLGDRGQLPSGEQSNAGGGEGWIWGSHSTGPYDRDKNTFFYVHIPGRIHKDAELGRPLEDGGTTEEVK